MHTKTPTEAKFSKIVNILTSNITIESNLIQSFEEFDGIYKARHDVIHALICQHRGYKFGEITFESFVEENKINLIDKTYYDMVKKQTPDVLHLLEDGSVLLLELSITQSENMENLKTSKYALLCHVLRRNKINYKTEIIIINPHQVYKHRPELIVEHRLDETTIDQIKKVCERSINLINITRSTDIGSSWYLQRLSTELEDQDIGFSEDDVNQSWDNFENKVSHTKDDMKKILSGNPAISSSDEHFIQTVYQILPKVKSNLTVQEKFDEKRFIEKINSYSNSSERRSIFPLPYMDFKNIDPMIRGTEKDLELLLVLGRFMVKGDDPIIVEIGKALNNKLDLLCRKSIKDIVNDDFLFPIKFDLKSKELIALEGPGRKKYINRNSQPHIDSQNKRRGYSMNYNTEIPYIKDLLMFFSQKTEFKTSNDIIVTAENLSELSGKGLRYALICQSIYRELNINCMRGDRRRNFICKPTGIDGVYVLIHKGTKLRAGELANSAWFKLLILRSNFIQVENMAFSWVFKKMYTSGEILHSEWLSVDVHRLDHYIRCYDKILMAYLATINLRYRTLWDQNNKDVDLTLSKLILRDESDLLGCIVSTFLEDRRSTSKTLQYVRYLVMTSISIFPYYESVMDKILEPIRSPLQLYFIKRMVQYIKDMKGYKLFRNYSYGAVKFDSQQKIFKDIMGGARLYLPHPIVTDPNNLKADFHEILSEMYFCMLFNKNQDDPTHASFQILTKMLEGEVSMQEMKKTGDHLGYRNDMTDEEWALHILHNSHSHKFSARAIEIGAKLLRSEQGDTSGTEIILAKNKKNLNKTIDEYATFKSSSFVSNEIFDSNKKQQNGRRRCIEGVLELIKQGAIKSFDVAKLTKNSNISFQIFKKNQIGGVREILILHISDRITINILETISRNICKFIPSEILTHGPEKNESLRDCLFEVRKKPYKNMSMFYSFDKSKWGPSFVPFQFFYLFKPFKKQLGSFYYFIASLLIRHQNKRCFYPDRLVNAWSKDPTNKLEHKMDPNLQALKTKFLSEVDKKIFFVNESNMGQGILHYTSSYLHAAMIAFRNRLYKMYCMEAKTSSNDHRDLFSSDDSFTVQSINVEDIKNYKKKIIMFLKCQEIAEKLFNCTTSRSKSSINPLIGEFNSLFLSNLTFFPTILKFAIGSVHPLNTDSFYRMVKESYISARQIVENGGSMELYMVSHFLNKKYCEGIYHTYKGGVNDPRTFGIFKYPFQVGYYPIFHPTLMLMFGPEYYNFALYKEFNDMSHEEQCLFKNSHLIAKSEITDSLAEMEEGDTMLGSLIRIEAKVGPIKQLLRIQKAAPMNKSSLNELIMNDPLLIIKRPETKEEILFKVCHKLYVIGAPEALKTITASIYYGRVSASVSAEAFWFPNVKEERDKPLRTYLDCLVRLIKSAKNYDLDGQIKFLYPRWFEYEKIDPRLITPILGRGRSVMEIQTIKRLAFHRVHTKLYNNVVEIFNKFWNNIPVPDVEENKFRRDWNVIKSFFPIVEDTLEQTMEKLMGTREEKTIGICMLILKIYSLRDKTFKGIIFGPSSTDISSSNESLIKYNFMTSRTYDVPLQPHTLPTKGPFDYNDIHYCHNTTILQSYVNENKFNISKLWSNIQPDDFDVFMTDPSVSKSIKKRVLMCMIYSGNMHNIKEWSYKTGTILHSWGIKQYKEKNKWMGDYEIMIFCGDNRIKVQYRSISDEYKFYKNDFDEPQLLYRLIMEYCELLQVKWEHIQSKLKPGQWVIDDKNKIMTFVNSLAGVDIIRDERKSDFQFYVESIRVNDDTTSIMDYSDRPIMTVGTGLLNCPHLPSFDMKSDIEINDISYKEMIRLGVLSQSFDIIHKNKKDSMELLTKLDYKKPKINIVTQEKLSLKGDWKISKEEEFQIELDKEPTTIDSLMNLEFSDFKDDVLVNVSDNFNDLSEFTGESFNQEFFVSVQTDSYITFPKRIFNNVIKLKSKIISHQLLSEMKINKETIELFRDIIKNDRVRDFIIYALIDHYDSIHHSDVSTPKNISMDINPEFLYKFDLFMK